MDEKPELREAITAKITASKDICRAKSKIKTLIQTIPHQSFIDCCLKMMRPFVHLSFMDKRIKLPSKHLSKLWGG